MSTVVGDGAHAYIAADGFWGISHQRAFFDVSVVNPFSESYRGHLCQQFIGKLKD